MKKFLICLMMVISAMFMSCTDEPVVVTPTIVITGQGGIPCYVYQPYQTNDCGQYVIGGYVAGAYATRAYEIDVTNDVLGNYNQFSLFMWTKDSVLTNSSGSMFNGVLSTNQNSWGYTESKKYFDNNQDSYAFLGVFPYETTYTLNADSTVDVPLMDFVTEGIDVNAKKYNKEFIVAKNIVNKADYATGATLAFEHQNSIVRIKFETDNTNNLEIIDFTPSVPAVPATPAKETYTLKSTKFIDELVNGNEVQVKIGFIGKNSTKLTAGNPNPLYICTNNGTWKSKDWLLSIKDAVNAQFVYYRLDQVNNSTSKTEVTEDWDSKDSNKNIYMMKLADGVDKTAFAAGNDVFWNALVAHDEGTADPWVGGSPAISLKSVFEQAYADGWRVVRINTNVAYKNFPSNMTEESTNANEVYVFLASNAQINTQICEVTPGNPGSPAVVGKEGIVVLPATSTLQTGKDAVLSTFPETVTANVGLNGVTYTVDTDEQEIIFTKAGIVAYEAYSPTNWYTFPITHANDFGFTIKFSYKIDLGNTGTYVTRYDARVFVPSTKCNWQPGKWYDYVIKVNSDKYGKTDPANPDVDPDDPKIEEEFPIIVNSTVDDYTNGESHVFNL